MSKRNSCEFTGYVGKSVFRDNGRNWTRTKFKLGVWSGKNKQTGKNEYMNIQVVCWFDADIKAGEEVTIKCEYKPKLNSRTNAEDPQFVINYPNDIMRASRSNESMERTESVATPEDDGFFESASSALDSTADIPF